MSVSNPLQGWMKMANGQYIRQYRFKEEQDARKRAFRAKECAILQVDVEHKASEKDADVMYWWVTLVHGAKPTDEAQQYISGK